MKMRKEKEKSMNRKLKIDELNYVINEVEQKHKNVAGTYFLGVVFGQLGLHRIYVGKVKSGLGRAVLSMATAVTMVVVGLGVKGGLSIFEIIGDSLVQNAALALLFIGLLTAHIVWYLVDLFLIPGWIEKLDTINEEVAIEKAIQSRFVEERLLKNTVTKELLDEVTEEVRENLADEIKNRAELVTLEELIKVKNKFEEVEAEELEESIRLEEEAAALEEVELEEAVRVEDEVADLDDEFQSEQGEQEEQEYNNY